MNTSPQSTSAYQVPVGRVLRSAIIDTFSNMSTLLMAVAGPLLVGIAGVLLVVLFQGIPVLALLAMLVAVMYAYGSFAVAWHRFVLQQEKPPLFQQDQKTVWLFAGMGVLLSIMLILVVAVIAFVLSLLTIGFTGLPAEDFAENPPAWMFLINLLASILIQYPMARLFLIFPAIATQRPWSLDMAFTASRGNGLRIMFAAFFVPMLAQQLLFMGIDQFFNPMSIGSMLGKFVIALPLGAVGIGALSICYRGLVLHPQQQAESPAKDDPE